MRYDLELAIAVLNGAVGDYLVRSQNGLAMPMQLFDGAGRTLGDPAAPPPIEEPAAQRAVALFVHGLMSTESVWEDDAGETYGARLARELGVQALFLRYNSGLHISQNGEALDALLCRWFAGLASPPDELLLVGHSMGGLVLRSACHFAATKEPESPWLGRVRRAFYLGSPHLGAPLERAGNALTWALRKVGATVKEPITELVADVLALRSAGVKDLRFGNLRHEDWEGHDPDALLRNRRHPVPLLEPIRHHLIAGTFSDDPTVSALFGDALVPVPSATGQARPQHRASPFPQAHVRVLVGMDHLRLAHDDEVYRQLRAWLDEPLEDAPS